MSAPYDSFTDFPNGATSFGVPLFGGGAKVVSAGPSPSSQTGRTWFVDTVFGANGNSGAGPSSPLQTMAAVFERLRSGDVVNVRGRISEQLVTPVQVFDVWINGMGNRPRHADAAPLGSRYAATQWGAPASGGVAAQATLRVLQQGWRFTNILFTAVDANAACLELVRNAGAGDAERDASHASIYGCRFSGDGIGIRSGVAGLFTEIVFNVEVADCDFNNMTTAMSGISGNGWKIRGNRFWANGSTITMALQNSHIYDNIIGSFTAAANSGGIDLNGGGGLCMVTKNFLSGAYSVAGGYRVSNANDNWWGNFADVTGGITQADPA